jgi:hypothetical protein
VCIRKLFALSVCTFSSLTLWTKNRNRGYRPYCLRVSARVITAISLNYVNSLHMRLASSGASQLIIHKHKCKPYYGMSKKSRNPKFRGKYFVSVIGKYKFAVPSGNTVLLWLQQICGLTRFLRICCSLVNCLFNKHHSVFNSAVCLLLNIIFEHSRMKQLGALSWCCYTK